MKIDNMKKMASVIGLLLSLVSAIFTIKLLTVFGNNGFEKLLYGVFGGCVQAAQTVCYIYACVCVWQGKPGRAIPGLVVFGLLFGLSLLGTIGFFSVNNKQMAVTATANSPELARYNNAIDQLNTEIANTQKVISDCQAKQLLSKCVLPQTEQLKRLQSERAELLSQVNSYKAVPVSDGVYEMIAGFFGTTEPEKIKFVIYVLYSIALDLTSVILLAYSIGWLEFGSDTETGGGNQIVRTGAGQGYQMQSEPGMAMAMQGKIPVPEQQYHEFMAVSGQMKERNHSDYADDPAYSQFVDSARTTFYPVSDKPSYEKISNSDSQTVPRTVHSTVQSTESFQNQSISNPESESGLAFKHNQHVKNVVMTDEIEIPEPVEIPPDKVTFGELLAYIDLLYPEKARIDGSLNGRRMIADRLNLTQRKVDKIHQYLKNSGLITVQGNKTFPNCEKAAMFSAVNQNHGNQSQAVQYMTEEASA